MKVLVENFGVRSSIYVQRKDLDFIIKSNYFLPTAVREEAVVFLPANDSNADDFVELKSPLSISYLLHADCIINFTYFNALDDNTLEEAEQNLMNKARNFAKAFNLASEPSAELEQRYNEEMYKFNQLVALYQHRKGLKELPLPEKLNL